MSTYLFRQHTTLLTCAFAACAFVAQTASAVEFSLFGSAAYSTHSHEKGFSLGPIDLIAEQTVSGTTKVAAEILIEDGEHGVEIDIERFNITKMLGESHEIKLGRFVKPLGFWNHNFFHGSLSQDTVTRPFFFEYVEQHEGIFPSHLVGAVFAGETESFTYQFALANSNGIDMTGGEEGDHFELRSLNIGDPSSDKTMVLRGTWQTIDSLELGFMFLNNQVVQTSEDSLPAIGTTTYGDTLFDQTVFGLDFNYRWNKFYTFGEYYMLSMKDNQSLVGAQSGSYDAKAHYWQIGYKFTDTISMAFRTESLTYSPGNTYLELLGLPQESHNLIAFHYRIEESNSIRVEFRAEDKKGPDAEKVSSINLQWFFYLL